MKDVRRLLAIGTAREGIGFGRVFHELLTGLKSSWAIFQLETQYRMDRHVPWPVVHTWSRFDQVVSHDDLRSFEGLVPDAVLIMTEVWSAARIAKVVKEIFPDTRVVAYCPVDGPLQSSVELSDMGFLDGLAVFTEFAKIAVEEKLNKPHNKSPMVAVVPHGISLSSFFPLGGDSTSLRRKLAYQGYPLPVSNNAFVVSNANQNTSRKRLDLTMTAFAIFAEGKGSDVQLCLHAGWRHLGVNVHVLARELGIEPRLVMTTNCRDHPCLTDIELNCIYNYADVSINTSVAEGWGLVAFEQAAAGSAQLLSATPNHLELWEGSASFISIEHAHCQLAAYVSMVPSAESAAIELARLYSNRDYLKNQQQLARARALAAPTWSDCAAMMNTLLA